MNKITFTLMLYSLRLMKKIGRNRLYDAWA